MGYTSCCVGYVANLLILPISLPNNVITDPRSILEYQLGKEVTSNKKFLRGRLSYQAVSEDSFQPMACLMNIRCVAILPSCYLLCT